MPNVPGIADHGAPATGLLASLPFRTFLQGIGVDVLLAVCLALYDGLEGTSVDWRLLVLTLVKTALMTVASSVMKRLKPPVAVTAPEA